MVCKRIYDFSVEFKDRDGNILNPRIRFISENYYGALYKLNQWLNDNKLILIKHTLVGDYNVCE